MALTASGAPSRAVEHVTARRSHLPSLILQRTAPSATASSQSIPMSVSSTIRFLFFIQAPSPYVKIRPALRPRAARAFISDLRVSYLRFNVNRLKATPLIFDIFSIFSVIFSELSRRRKNKKNRRETDFRPIKRQIAGFSHFCRQPNLSMLFYRNARHKPLPRTTTF